MPFSEEGNTAKKGAIVVMRDPIDDETSRKTLQFVIKAVINVAKGRPRDFR